MTYSANLRQLAVSALHGLDQGLVPGLRIGAYPRLAASIQITRLWRALSHAGTGDAKAFQ